MVRANAVQHRDRRRLPRAAAGVREEHGAQTLAAGEAVGLRVERLAVAVVGEAAHLRETDPDRRLANIISIIMIRISSMIIMVTLISISIIMISSCSSSSRSSSSSSSS